MQAVDVVEKNKIIFISAIIEGVQRSIDGMFNL